MKHANSNRELTINKDLRNIILDILTKTPEIDQERMVEAVLERKTLRMPKETIKVGVEAYYRTKNGSVGKEQSTDKDKMKSLTEMIDVDQKPTKKIKKN